MQLQAVTEAGRGAVRLAEQHRAQLAARALRHDAQGEYVAENIDEIRESGLLGMCVPQEFGGLGVTSLHDTAVVMSRLARGCGSTALATNMVVTQMLYRAAMLSRARSLRDQTSVDRWQAAIQALDASGLVYVVSASEPGAAWGVPYTTAVPVAGGYLVNGRKVLATNSEIGDVFSVSARIAGEEGWSLGEVTLVPGMPGFDVRDDWDGMGMRGTGSNSLRMIDCLVPDANVTVSGPLQAPGPADLELHCYIDFPMVAAYLGIAEAGRDQLATLLDAPSKQPFTGRHCDRPEVRREIADIEVSLFTARAAVARAGLLLDEHLSTGQPCTKELVQCLFKEWQCAKLVVNECAQKVVTKCLALLGGRGYSTGSPLSRMYRDVLAGTLMQPFSTIDGLVYIGEVACGLEPLAELRRAVGTST